MNTNPVNKKKVYLPNLLLGLFKKHPKKKFKFDELFNYVLDNKDKIVGIPKERSAYNALNRMAKKGDINMYRPKGFNQEAEWWLKEK